MQVEKKRGVAYLWRGAHGSAARALQRLSRIESLTPMQTPSLVIATAIVALLSGCAMTGPGMTPEWKPEFNKVVASALIGKYVLVGLTYRNKATDAVENYTQKHGEVIAADEKHGIVIRNRNTGEEYTLPPDTSRFEKAKPGSYRLKSTGEVIVDPDFVCTWTVYEPQLDS